MPEKMPCWITGITYICKMKAAYIIKDKEKSIYRKHPWIFSGAIQKFVIDENEQLLEGDLIKVFDYKSNFLAIGYFCTSSIAIKILSFENSAIDINFWIEKISNAIQLRKELCLVENKTTNIFRLLHAEGDHVPGLIIDIYNNNAVIQCHEIGIYNFINEITEALDHLLGSKLNAVYLKSKDLIKNKEISDRYLIKKKPPEFTAIENNCLFKIDWEEGQKSGFFIDQRENRKLLMQFSKNKIVLNTFCYSGGFSIAALKGGAKSVVSVDSSKKAIDLTNENIELNNLSNHKSEVCDTLKFLQQNAIEIFDVVILDPPAFAKNNKSKHNAVQGYKRLNTKALKKMKKGSFLFTFSCSQAINRKLFYDTITAAAIESGRNIKLLYHLSQPPDHPVNICHPEGEYLKGFVFYVT